MIVGGVGGCFGVQQRFPDDVQTALAHGEMRRLETERFIVYYPAHRRAEIDRFVARAERCANHVRAAAVVKQGAWNDKMVIVMPETAFNNAFVMGEQFGYEHVAVIPTVSTLDFTTEFGLLPDPGITACHELVHYVHFEQIAGFWRWMDRVFGYLYSPQFGADSWFFEGLATHYEAKLSPGVGRPSWPIFTGMFAAAYAGEHMSGGDLSSFARLSPVGHNYLVGTMFLRFLTERYGEPPVWAAIASQARGLTGILFPKTFKDGFGKSLGTLLDEFDAWHAQRFPVRLRPAGQRALATLGNDARYARGRDGTEAWVADDVDQPPRLVVRDPGGATLAELRLLDLLPPRTLVDAAPLLVSGLSVTADGREVWLTVNDRDAVEHVPRLLRWRRGEGSLTELGHALGPGATIDPTGATYYYCAVDGDRWSLAAWDVARGTRRVLIDSPPGTYVLGAQVSPDGARVIADVWDGSAFVAWVLDAATGARLAEIRGAGTPIWDASFTDDGRAMYLGVVDARFQLFIDGRPVTDAPYAVLAARSARGTIRFLNREGWSWTLDEIAAPPADAPPATASAGPAAASPTAPPATAAAGPPAASPAAPPATAAGPAAASPTAPPATAAAGPPDASPAAPPAGGPVIAPPSSAPVVLSDEPFSPWERFFFPQLRAPTIVATSGQQAHLGVVLGGGDRLGLQRWSLSVHAQPPTTFSDVFHWGGDAAYLNTMLAPWQIFAIGSFIAWADPVTMTGTTDTLAEERHTRDAALAVSRTWRDTFAATLEGLYTDDYDRPPGRPGIDRRLGGPGLSLAWFSGESTPYTGARLALLASGSAAYYPHDLSTFTGDIYDTAAELDTVVPLPIGARHTLTLQLRGRALLARDDTNLLQVGGLGARGSLWNGRSVASEPPTFDDARFPPNLRFVEYLRGYEDYAITTDRVGLASLTWRYPLIIDRGGASVFSLFPAVFVRQLDLELFGAGAVDQRQDLHAAGGAEMILHVEVMRIALQLGFQVARRVRDDEAATTLLELGAGL